MFVLSKLTKKVSRNGTKLYRITTVMRPKIVNLAGILYQLYAVIYIHRYKNDPGV